MLEIKAHHKELKRAVNEVEDKRKQDRFIISSIKPKFDNRFFVDLLVL